MGLAETIVASILAGGAGAGLVLYLVKTWFETRLKSAVQHEYDVRLEKIREATLVKAKAEVIAELFAEWLSYPEDQRRLNQLTLEAFLWLPDDILRDLSALLAHRVDDPGVRDIIVRVRKHLLGSNDLPAREVIIFTQQYIAKRRAGEAKDQQGASYDAAKQHG